MSDSIYAPPEADVSEPASGGVRYYIVAPFKFILLSLLTFTLYFVYWFYKNWQLIKIDDNDDIWPVPRSIFYIFFTHSLFTDVQESFKTQGRQWSWSPGLLATVFVVLTVINNVADRFIDYDSYSMWLGLWPLASAFVLTFLLLPAQKAINAVCGDEGGTSNARLTIANWIWMVLGGLMWLLVLIGIYAVIEDPTLQ